ncbi:MAG: YcbK family protein, partial [Aquamicrobium sp.]|nr:YcbK family protein [Aquamicrobium sp.]
ASPAQPLVQLAATGEPARPLIAQQPAGDANPLPGVRQDSLFEISRRSGLDDDSDIDLHEGDEPPYQLASAAGLARLAPNGLLKQTDHVDVACLKPSLVRVLKTVERHYGRKVVVTSGYRSPDRNRRARGARNSLHMYCAAADVQVEGVSKWDLAQFVRSMPGRGGVGTYCHTDSVHIDVGPERDWNWRCRRRK